MQLRRIVLLLAICLAALPARAQFYNEGNEPAGVRWYHIQTPGYNVIYPEGLDSLATIYATRLEAVRQPVGATAGYIPNQNYRKPLPVVLHPWTSYANGMVTWIPSRMELYTTPDFDAPLPEPWEAHLTVHESRHVSQMQFSNDKRYRLWRILFGQLYAGAMDVIYCGQPFFEGDAVVAETELSHSGRGRNAAFLEYYRAAFREGDTRDWWKWRYGSLKYYAPNYYTIGYITAAGMRSVYNAPDFTARYYKGIVENKCWPWPILRYPKTVKEVSGGKRFREAFKEISDTLQQRWSRDEAARAPFQPSERLTPVSRHYTDYSSVCVLDSALFCIRTGTTSAPELVRVDINSGATKTIRPFAHSCSALKEDTTRACIWWSEIVSDTRWEMISFSEVWSCDARGRLKRLRKNTRWYNPAVSADGQRLAVVEYLPMGGSAVLVIDPCSGEELERYSAPAGMQVVEVEWIGDALYACAITSSGQGLYSVRDSYASLLDCGNNVVKQLYSYGGDLYFVSDLGGVDELYRYELASGQAWRISNTPVGSGSFCFLPGGDKIFYSMLTRDGRFLYSTAASELLAPQEADFGTPHRYEFAEELSESGPGIIEKIEPQQLEAPKPYSKLANAFRFHSWVPIYVDYNAIDDLSLSSIASSAGLGATAFFQNNLSTLSGTVAYNASYRSKHWRHLGEAKITYSGLYPKIEASFSVHSDPPSWYYLMYKYTNFSRQLSVKGEDIEGLPSFSGSVLVYLPLSFSNGGWYRGVVPQLRWSVSNSVITKGNTAPMNRLSASVRAYVIKSTPSSCIYPKLGVGAEAGWSGRPGATGIFNPNAYLYTYGYLPGFMDTHGIRISAIAQMPYGEAPFCERYASVMPRGMGDYSELTSQLAGYPFQSRVTMDYAFPFAPLDWSGLGPVAYLRNFECTLHGDYSFFGSGKNSVHIGGAGLECCAVLGNLLWIPYDTRIGIKYYYNIGIPSGLNPHQFDMVFSVDL